MTITSRVRQKRKLRTVKGNTRLHLPQVVTLKSGFPLRLRQKLRYNETVLVAPTGTNDQQYLLNSIFAPTPGGGHQPLGQDQWTSFYTRYVVLGVHVHVEYQATGTTASTTTPLYQHVAVCATTTNSAITEVSTAAEQSSGSFGKISTPFGPPVIFDKYFKLRDIYGVDDESLISDDGYSALFTTSPTKLARLHILTSVNGASAYSGVTSTTLVFDCEFFSPQQLSQST